MKLTKRLIFEAFILLSIFAFLFLSFFLIIFSNISYLLKIEILVILFMLTIMSNVSFFIFKKKFYNRENFIKNSINNYIENLVSSMSVGIIILEPNGKIIWVSEFIEERFSNKIVNSHISNLISEINFEKTNQNIEKVILKNEFAYQINFIYKDSIIIIKDITQEYSATHFYEIERLVLGEIEIDNFQQYRVLLSEEEIFLVQTTIINLLESLSKKYNFSFKQYADGKFIVLTNRNNLNKMMINNFEEIEKLHKLEIIKNARISLSIGFGIDSSNYLKLMEMAKEGLRQSQSRGGDQITVISKVEKPKYFGSKSEIAILRSRTKIKNISTNLKIALQNKDIKNVIIYGHKVADLDSLGASYAIYEIAKALGKETYIQNNTFDDTAKKSIEKYLKNNSKMFISPSKASSITTKNTLVIIVDCADETRVENQKVFMKGVGKNFFIFDHHRISELNNILNELNVYVETSASSASEIVTEMILFNQFFSLLSKEAIQMLLNGIYLDTSQFKKSVSSRTFFAASILEEWGAKAEESIAILKISQEINKTVNKILSNLQEIKPGYWLASYSEVVSSDVVAIAADEILRIDGRKAAFVIAKQPKNSYFENDSFKLSARSVGVNVQLIAEAVGGGGHFNSAAAISDAKAKETLETFTDNVIQAIISTKNEVNR